MLRATLGEVGVQIEPIAPWQWIKKGKAYAPEWWEMIVVMSIKIGIGAWLGVNFKFYN